MTLDDLKRDLTGRFREAGIEGADMEARWLLEHVLGCSSVDLVLRASETVSLPSRDHIHALAKRRLDGEPLDHILGYRDFYGRRFEISKDVLSPRPETEGLVDAALDVIGPVRRPNVLDLGTGSGAIIISLLAERPDALGVAVDISEAALDIAKTNARQHDVTERLTFKSGSWFAPVSGVFDLIVSNPPYISDEAMTQLPPEVRDFDPEMALAGGREGLGPYGFILNEASQFLAPDGHLIFEIGFDQGPAVSRLMAVNGFVNVRILHDLAGHDRIVAGTKSEK